MGFEIVQPGGQFGAAAAIPKGTLAVDKRGIACVRADDLADAGIGERVVILADVATKRLALRAMRAGEENQSLRIVTVLRGKRKKRPTDRRRVSLTRALKMLGVPTLKAAGRRELLRKDDLLIANFK